MLLIAAPVRAADPFNGDILLQADAHLEAVSADAAGNFVLLSYGIVPGATAAERLYSAQLFDAFGSPLSSAFPISATPDATIDGVALARNGRGAFVISWLSGGAGTTPQIVARLFAANGTPVTGNIHVSGPSTGTKVGSVSPTSVGIDAGGRAVVAWATDTPILGPGGLASNAISAQRLDADGALIGRKIAAGSGLQGPPSAGGPAVLMEPDGNFSIVSQAGTLLLNNGVDIRRYNPAGGQTGLPHTLAGSGNPSLVIREPDGSFVAALTDTSVDSATDIFARRYSKEGFGRGPRFLVNSFVQGEQSAPVIASNARGDLLIGWTSSGQVDGDDIFAQRYSVNGGPIGEEFRVNQITPGRQSDPRFAMDSLGNGLAVFSSGSQPIGDIFGHYLAAP